MYIYYMWHRYMFTVYMGTCPKGSQWCAFSQRYAPVKVKFLIFANYSHTYNIDNMYIIMAVRLNVCMYKGLKHAPNKFYDDLQFHYFLSLSCREEKKKTLFRREGYHRLQKSFLKSSLKFLFIKEYMTVFATLLAKYK